MTQPATEPFEFPTRRTQPFDPPAELGQLRDERPLCPLRYSDGAVGWLATSHGLARAVLSDPRFEVRPLRPPPVGAPETAAAVYEATADDPTNAGSVILLDPPEHTRVRRLQTAHFTARRMSEHRAQIERIVADRLDAMEQIGPPLDLVETFALPASSFAICELLGVPRSDSERFEHLEAIVQDPTASVEEKLAANLQFADYVRGVIAHKRAHPSDDLLSELVAGGELSDEELTGVARLLFGAGHHTTATMLAFSTFALLCERDRWERLRADPSSIDGAVEELLRYLTIVQTSVLTRNATEDVELAGVPIRAGESVTVSLSAANRDPDRFADPDTLDIARDAMGHVAFGYGRHMCLGQHLARIEIQIGLAGLIRRFPTLHLNVSPDEVPMHSGDHLVYGVRELPVAW